MAPAEQAKAAAPAAEPTPAAETAPVAEPATDTTAGPPVKGLGIAKGARPPGKRS